MDHISTVDEIDTAQNVVENLFELFTRQPCDAISDKMAKVLTKMFHDQKH